MEDIIKFDDSIPSPEIYSNLYYMIYNQQLNIDLINELLNDETFIDIVRG